jgi:formylglycine-generating enzyme
MTNCGATTSQNCCATFAVAGGTYARTFSDDGGLPSGEADTAAISTFDLDAYEVTVGRFRQFVSAWANGTGYEPSPGAGKHTHLTGGLGLANSASPGTYEPGWLAADDGNIQTTDANLGCDGATGSWTNTAGSNENLPMTCENWWEAFAFCIWDSGFLPSEAEWEYAAAGGSQEREYPWGGTPPGTANQYAIYNCLYPTGISDCQNQLNLAPVGTTTLGASVWGQFDLAGNAWEWNADWYNATFVDPCVDCAYLPAQSPPTTRVLRSGASNYAIAYLASNYRTNPYAPGSRINTIGFRCARSP